MRVRNAPPGLCFHKDQRDEISAVWIRRTGRKRSNSLYSVDVGLNNDIGYDLAHHRDFRRLHATVRKHAFMESRMCLHNRLAAFPVHADDIYPIHVRRDVGDEGPFRRPTLTPVEAEISTMSFETYNAPDGVNRSTLGAYWGSKATPIHTNLHNSGPVSR